MLVVNEDNSIHLTRGDYVVFSVTADDDTGRPFTFKKDYIVRFKVFEKKNCIKVVFEKDFFIDADSQEVKIILTKEDTTIGDVISKPRDYWYEVEVNPDTKPQTIIGYDENGPSILKLYPEGHVIE